MKVLLANTFLFVKGGADKVFLDEAAILEQHGHRVILFGMQHPSNPTCPHSHYQLSNLDFGTVLSTGTVKERVGAAVRVLYSTEAFAKFSRLIEDERPDIIHFHNIQNHISLSVLRAANLAGIPVVWTLHDYELVCPAVHLLRRGRPCEECAANHFFKAILYKCKKGNLPASVLAAISAYFQHYVLRVVQNVSLFISPSQFLKTKLVTLGIPVDKIIYLPNPVSLPTRISKKSEGRYCVYVGRLSAEKRVALLIEAAAKRDIPLHVIGDGPDRKELQAFASKLGAANIRFCGHLSVSETTRQIQEARFSVLPSVWYENFPLTIAESFAVGTPVIASRLGGCMELVDDGRDGFLFTPGNIQDLTEKMSILWESPELAVSMGVVGKQKINTLCNPTFHYEGLLQVYTRALGRHGV